MRSVTVVICTCERPVLLERCLAAVRRSRYPVAGIVVADNAPASGGAAAIAARHGAAYVAVPVRGVSRVRNAGARACASDVIAYLDDDMVPHRDWLAHLVRELDDERVMAVAGPVLPDTLAADPRADLAREVARRPWGPRRFRVDSTSEQWFERANFGGIGDGNMAFRAEAFARWPGFEERIGRGMTISGGEEHYAYFALIACGYAVAYTPAAIVFHHHKERSRAGELRAVTEGAAYLTFVAARHPRFLPRILRFVVEGALGKKRAWRIDGESERGGRPSFARTALAFLAGPWVCWRGLRKAGRGQPAPVEAILAPVAKPLIGAANRPAR